MGTITITFGDQAENHVGMQKLGNMSEDGFSIQDLKDAKKAFENKGYECELVKLHHLLNNVDHLLNDVDPLMGVNHLMNGENYRDSKKLNFNVLSKACILIIRRGVEAFRVDVDDLRDELTDLQWDTKAKMYGRVVDKHARYNLCFDKNKQNPDYAAGKGRVIAFDDIPLLNKIRRNLHKFFGERARGLVAEGNLYYNTEKCGIGYHGDSERRRVIALRLGDDMKLCYHYYFRNKRVGKKFTTILRHGDMYIMSEKAVGTDWKSSSIATLRHAAGCDKFTK